MRDTPERTFARGLDALFAPRSVAIVGASDDRDRLAGRPVRYLLDAGFTGRIYPVNPKRATVQGLAAHPDIESLPETPDLALIVVPPIAAREAVRACATRGVAGVYLLSGGFAERGEEGLAIQREIESIARAAGMRLLGPNCLGAFNAASRFFGSFATSLERGLPDPGPIGVVCQSGAYGQHLAFLLRRRGLGVHYLITTGNEVDVELAECIEWLVDQPQIDVILAYAEGARDGPRLLRALDKAARAGKPVVFVKVGSSDAGSRAAASHTAAMAGVDKIYDAALRQFGALRADSTEAQVDVAYALCRAPSMRGRRVCIVSVSGGFGVQSADAAHAAGLDVAPMPPIAREKLSKLLATRDVDNPLDVTGQVVNDLHLLADALSIVGEDGDCDALILCLTTVPLARALCEPLRQALVSATMRTRMRMPVALVTVADPETVEVFEAAGFLVYEDAIRAARALGAVAQFSAFCRRIPPSTFSERRSAASDPIGAARLSEVGAKSILRDIGIATLPEHLASTADEACRAASAVGFPVALKIVSAQIVHKTDIGGVMLDVGSVDAVRASFATLIGRAAVAHPDATIEGVLVAPMAPQGVEVIIGTTRDPTFGAVVMFGLGGVLAECFGDVALRVAPIDEEEARRMIEETRAGALLKGWRGAPPADVDSVVRALVALSRFAAEHVEDVETIDVNPLLVLPRNGGAVALDAVLVGARR